jgi:hypothetical protein
MTVAVSILPEQQLAVLNAAYRQRSRASGSDSWLVP